MKIEVDKDDLQEVLMRLMDNDKTSASTAGLQLRGYNRRIIIKELLFMLALTEEEAENLYWTWFNDNERIKV